MERELIESIENALRSNDCISDFKVSDDSCLSQSGEEFCQKWDFQFLLSEMIDASLCIKSDFPRSSPEIFIKTEYYGKWPHVEKNGKLCLFGPSTTFRQSDKEGIIECTIKRAYSLLNKSIKGENTADFKNEMHSYWEQCAPNKINTRIISILTPTPKTKIVSAHWAKGFVLLADNTKQAKQWLSNYYDGATQKKYKFFDSIFVNIGDNIICPTDYPKNGIDLLKLLNAFSINIDDEIQKTFTELSPLIIICINVKTKDGNCLVASIQKRSHNDKQIENGFRGFDKMPPHLFKNRIFGSKLYNVNVERADVSWVHGRDKNSDVDVLSKKTVTVIGCGSVGSPVAELLLESGIGKINLIDGENLSTANVSRHVLGMDSTGKSKAQELCSKFRRSYPHLAVQEHHGKWDKIRGIRGIFESSDLILELTADTYSRQKLNAWHTVENKRNIPIIYGYTENHATAGFCITIGQSGGDIECALDERGQYVLKITKWLDGDIHQEAGCGAEFASYGAIELQHTTSLIAQKTVEVLLQPHPLTSEIKCWVANKETVIAAGGEWDEDWKMHPSFRDGGSITFSQKIPEKLRQCA